MVVPEDVAFRTTDAGSPEAGWALAQYFAELDQRFVGGFDVAGALAQAPSSFNPPSGLFVVVHVGDDIAGCGAIQWIDDETAEIKRMWVDAQRRGIGLGRRLLGHLESAARATGRTRVVLDTNETLSEAVAMYGALGYVAIARYNDNPYAHHWFEKTVADRPG
jgi:GNAT superfamily N-acetyltransferase